MPGPRYVKDFEFPKSFGFTGSGGDVSIRQHTRQKFAKGGKVGRRPPLKPSPGQVVGGALAAGAAAAAYEKLRKRDKPKERLSVGETMDGGIRRRRERELGLKKGGKVKSHRMPDGSMMKDSKMGHGGRMKDC